MVCWGGGAPYIAPYCFLQTRKYSTSGSIYFKGAPRANKPLCVGSSFKYNWKSCASAFAKLFGRAREGGGLFASCSNKKRIGKKINAVYVSIDFKEGHGRFGVKGSSNLLLLLPPSLMYSIAGHLTVGLLFLALLVASLEGKLCCAFVLFLNPEIIISTEPSMSLWYLLFTFQIKKWSSCILIEGKKNLDKIFLSYLTNSHSLL